MTSKVFAFENWIYPTALLFGDTIFNILCSLDNCKSSKYTIERSSLLALNLGINSIIDYKNITGRSLENNQVLYDGFFYDLGNLIRRSDPNQKFLIDVNDIDENFYKIYIHYKIHRI